MENKGSKLISGSVLRLAALVAMVVASFFLTPFIIQHIGTKMFGFWSLSVSILGTSALMDLGLSTALKRYLPKYYAENNLKKANEVVCSTGFSFIIIGIMTLLMVVLLAKPLHELVGKGVALNIFKTVVIVLGVDAALQFPMRTLIGYFESHLKYGLMSAIDIIKTLSRASLIYYFLFNNHGIIAIAIITLFVNLSGNMLLIAFYFVRHGDIQLRWKYIRFDTIKELFIYSYKNVVSALANLMRYNVDNLIIANFIGVSTITPYVIGSSIAKYFLESVSAFMGQTVPVFSYIDAENDIQLIKQVYFLLLKIAIFLSVYIGGMLIILGSPFILRWMGKGFETSYTVLSVLTIGLTFSLSQFPTYNLLRGISKHSIVMFCSLGEGIANVILSIILVRYHGIVGVAFGTMIPMVISFLIVMPILTSRSIAYFNLIEFYLKNYGPAFLKSIFLMLVFYFCMKPFLLPDYLRLFLLGLLSLLYFPLIYIFGFSKIEKIKFLMPRARLLKLLQS